MPTKYDDASWHFDGDFPEESPIEYGGTHIALFLKWCLQKGWASDELLELASENVQKVIDGMLSATEFLFEFCDGKLIDTDLSPQGNEFARDYYGNRGLYFGDYVELFGELMYSKPESDHDFARLSEMMEQRFLSGNLTKKPFWKFW